MKTPAQIAGHPIHPMLVTLPIGMWVFSLAADLIAMRSASPDVWHAAALYSMIGGIIGALLAALPGLVDLLSLRDTAIKSTAIKHMGLNLTIVVLYVINAWLRVKGSASPNATLWLSIISIAMLLVSGWLGGKMVYEAGVAVGPAPETAADTGAWTADRSGRVRTTPAGAGAARTDRAMASDAERPSREGEPRRE
jgi:uncharacterized membrane protein